MKNTFLDARTMFMGVAFASFLFVGCGGGGGSAETTTSEENTTTEQPPVVKTDFKYNRISIAGSSITHGQSEGYLGEGSYVGAVEKYFREEVADTAGPDNLRGEDRSYNDPMSYQGIIKVYNAGKILSGTLEASDEISIVYAGSPVKTVVELEVDGKVYPTYEIPVGTYSPAKKTFDDTNNQEVQNFYYSFRETNERAVYTWKLDSYKVHSFKLKVVQGELHLNFITNHMYYMQNAGDSGFQALDFLSTGRTHSTIADVIAFDPDLFVFESSTNDAQTWKNELLGKDSTNHWIVEDPVDFTTSGNTITLAQTVSVQKGDVVIMGEYNGDIQNMAVGIIANDSTGNTITLSKVVTYTDRRIHEYSTVPSTIVKKCRIKNIALWESRVKEVIAKLKNGLNHPVKIAIGTSGVPNYYYPYSQELPHVDGIADDTNSPRRLLGYREKGEMMAQENGWEFVDFFKYILRVVPGVDINRQWSIGDNTHPNELGRPVFGQAVIDVVK